MMAVGVRWIGGPFFGFMNIGRGGMKRRRGTKSSRRRKTPGGGKNGPPSRRTTTTSRAARSQPRELLQQAMQHHLSGGSKRPVRSTSKFYQWGATNPNCASISANASSSWTVRTMQSRIWNGRPKSRRIGPDI